MALATVASGDTAMGRGRSSEHLTVTYLINCFAADYRCLYLWTVNKSMKGVTNCVVIVVGIRMLVAKM